MPIETVAGTQYYLLSFDKGGHEACESNGSFLRTTLLSAIGEQKPTDIFVLSHGWMGDLPAAQDQYNEWIKAFLSCEADLATAIRRPQGFRPLVVGLHWPSLPWGDETMPSGKTGVLSGPEGPKPKEGVDFWADRIADTPTARNAISIILDSAHSDGTISLNVREAYQRLFQESKLTVGDKAGKPGADQEAFDIDVIVADSPRFLTGAAAGPGVLGTGFLEGARDLVLAPLRTLSFWKMKDRARIFGEGAAHDLLAQLQKGAPDARIHLMGHSFGCIVVSATIAGAAGGEHLPRPVDTLFLVQGALSLWAFAENIPYAGGGPGYFRPIIDERLVRGRIFATTSRFDSAVGRFYPIGARVANQYILSSEYPQYGGIGTYGLRGVPESADLILKDVAEAYEFDPTSIDTVECSRIIRTGSGASGAHSDIAHPEIAHLFWSGILSLPHEPQVVGTLGNDEPEPSVLLESIEPDFAAAPAAMEIPSRDFGVRRSAAFDTSSTDHQDDIPQARFLTADIEDRAADERLKAGSWYTLSFGVDLQSDAWTVAKAPLADIKFEPGMASIVVSVQLDSDDFAIATKTLPLTISSSGASPARAKFGVSPTKDGAAVIRATVHKDGNFLQEMQLTFEIGASASPAIQTTSIGRTVAAADTLTPRAVSLIIESRTPEAYDCRVVGAVATRAQLMISSGLLAGEIKLVRAALLSIVQTKAGNDLPFQTRIEIDQDKSDAALGVLARAGARLYRKMFFGPGARQDSISLGEYLRKMLLESEAVLNLQVSAESLPIPWALLYLGDPEDQSSPLSWDHFLGFRHIVEQIPLQNVDPVRTPIIKSKPSLRIATYLNTGIDQQFNTTVVADQVSFWNAAQAAQASVKVESQNTRDKVFEALCDSESLAQILYFYCHAASYDLADPKEPGASKMSFVGGDITLDELQARAPITRTLRGRPLAFINACESAELSALFYDGFVPYFVARGGRGVIGTECSTPALFAADWAKRFFPEFLAGVPLGALIFKLRSLYLQQYRNPLGLLYAVYCDPHTQVDPAMRIGDAA